MRSILADASDPVLVTDAFGVVVYANKVAHSRYPGRALVGEQGLEVLGGNEFQHQELFEGGISAGHLYRLTSQLSEVQSSLTNQIETLTTLHEMAMALAGEIGLEDALALILQTTVSHCDADFGMISVAHPDGHLRAGASIGVPEEVLEELERVVPRPETGASFSSFATRQRVIVSDIDEEPKFDSVRHLAHRVGFRSVHSTPIVSRSGRILGVLSAYARDCRTPSPQDIQFADMCARHAAEALESAKAREALERSEFMFREMADHAPVMLWITDRSGACTYLSKTWQEFTGQEQSSGLGIGWLDQVHPEERQRVGEEFRVRKQGREPFRVEYRLRTTRGEYRHVIDAARPNFGPEGEFRGFVGCVIDVTDEKRKEEALVMSEKLYRAIGESLDYGIWLTDHEGHNTYISDSWLALVGLSQDECYGFDWASRLHPDEREDTLAAWADHLKSGRPWYREHSYLGVDGEYHPVLSQGVPVRNDDGQIIAWAGINLDVSRLKSVESELRAADRRKDEFLATLAHELRNPLAPILTGLELLSLSPGDADIVERVRPMMVRQTRHMVRLVDDLLDVSRITRGVINLRKSRIDLVSAVANAIEAAEPLIRERDHILEVTSWPEPIHLEADPTRLAQIITNLLNNAAKYTEPGGRIRLITSAEDGMAVIRVQDNGIGIEPDSLSRVFDMFMQGEGAPDVATGGLGIGLTLVKRLVGLHGGAVEVHSTGPGEGSEFVVRLPMLAAGAVVYYGISETPTAVGGFRILVADDNADAAMILRLMLEMMGNEVEVANGGYEAFRLAGELRPDIIFLDIGMPDISGLETAEMIRREPWGREPILAALTGWGLEEDRRRTLEAGFDYHFVKPIEMATLEKFLDSQRIGTPA